MIPFKYKSRGIIKSTTVLLILVSISESFSLLQSSPKNSKNLRTFLNEYQRQDQPKEESRNSRNFERETLEISPYIRDVRADSRQSRIDATDIRTDFREIRTELKKTHQETRYQRDSSYFQRVAIERRHETEDTRERQNVRNIRDFRKNNGYSHRQMKKQLPEKSVRNLNNRHIFQEQTLDQEISRRNSMNNMQTSRVRSMEAISDNQKLLNERLENRQEIQVADNNREQSREKFPQRELTYNQVGQYSVSRLENTKHIGQSQTLRTRHSIIHKDENVVRYIETNSRYNGDRSYHKQQKSFDRENRQTTFQNNQRYKNDNLNYLLPREWWDIRVLRDNSRKIQNDNTGLSENRLQLRNNRKEQTPSQLLKQGNIFMVNREITFESNIPIRDYRISEGNSVHLMRRQLRDREFRDISDSFRETSGRMDRRNIQLLGNYGHSERSVKRHITERIQNRENDLRLWDSSRQSLIKLEENKNRVKLSSGRRSYRLTRKNRIVSAQRNNSSERRGNIRLSEYTKTNSQFIRNNRFATNQNRMSDRHLIREDSRNPIDISQVRSQTSLLLKKNTHSGLNITINNIKLDWARTVDFQEESTKNIRSRETDRHSREIIRRTGEQHENRITRQMNLRVEESETCLKHRLITEYGNDIYRISRVGYNAKHKRELELQPIDRRIQFNRDSAKMKKSDRQEIHSSQQRQQYTKEEPRRKNNDSLSMRDNRAKVVTRGLELIPNINEKYNIFANALQAILLITLFGQIMGNNSKSKFISANWRCIFAKEKAF